MANCVDASVDPMQAVRTDAAIPRAPGQSGILELPHRHGSVLPRRDPSDSGVRIAVCAFCTHVGALSADTTILAPGRAATPPVPPLRYPKVNA